MTTEQAAAEAAQVTQQAENLTDGMIIDEGNLEAPMSQEDEQATAPAAAAPTEEAPPGTVIPDASATSEDEPGAYVETDDEKVQARINKITAEKYAEKKRADNAERQLAEAQAKQPKPDRPKLESFPTQEAYEDALFEWRDATRPAVAVATIDPAVEINQVQQQYDERRLEHQKANPTYITDVAQLPDFPGETFDMMLRHNNGPALFHHLAKHLDIAEKVAGMDTVQAAMFVGTLNANLTQARKKAASAAPDPIEPVKPGTGAIPTGVVESELIAGATFE